MSTALLSIGTELTRGEIENSNSTWLSRQITELGESITSHETTPDDLEAISAALKRLGRNADWIICTGGLGPTTDDITSQAVAYTLGVDLERNAEAETRIHELLKQYKMAPTLSNLKQADLPHGAVMLQNEWGSAPGFSVQIGKATAFFFPGVPREMKGLTQKYAIPAIAKSINLHTACLRLQVFGAPESQINDQLANIESELDVSIGYRVRFPTLEIKALATAKSPEAALRRSEVAVTEIERRLGKLAYARGTSGLPETVGVLLSSRKWSLGLAESCTGGLISSLFTMQPCSDYFHGSIVTYTNRAKERLLGVDPEVLKQQGAVSEATVRQMASGAQLALEATVSIAISGLAGPSGGSDEKPLGLVHWAVATPTGTVAYQRIFRGDRSRIQRAAAFAAIDSLRRVLLDS